MSITVERVDPPVTIKIEILERTAERLCALIGTIGGVHKSDPELYELFVALDISLPHRVCTAVGLFEHAKVDTDGGLLRRKGIRP